MSNIDYWCTYCKVGILHFVNAVEPYTTDHYICIACDSTYTIEYIKEKYKLLEERETVDE